MAGSIKLFQFVQQYHQIIGIYHPSQSNQKHRPYNFTQAIFLICFTQMIITIAAFLLFEDISMFDYGIAVFILVAMITSTVIYLQFIWLAENTLKFIENCEKFIEKSKCTVLNICKINLLFIFILFMVFFL